MGQARHRRSQLGVVPFAILAVIATAVVPLVTSAPAAATAVAVSDGYSLSLVRSGFNKPHAIRYAPDGRLFLLEQDGRVKIVRAGGVTTALTLDPTNVVAPGGSAGLLSIAFPPDFMTAAVQHVYMVYTHEPMAGYGYPHNVVSRFTISGDTIDPASEEILVHLDSLVGADGVVKTMHYGGDMEFGADGKLYVTTGDLLIGPNAQSLANRYGKVLRYNPDGSIPNDNPFADTLFGPFRAIWAYGLRNPFKIAQDPANGSMLIGDVGSSTWEEINLLPTSASGSNFGWSDTEGYTSDPRFVSPLLAYPHDPALAGVGEPHGCAVMGGDIYRPDNQVFPRQYRGDLFFADHCEGWLRTIDPDTGAVGPALVTGLEQPVDMAVAPNGSVMIISRELAGTINGSLLRLDYTGVANAPPSLSSQPKPVTVALGQQATFEVFASGSTPLSYQWTKNGAPINGATDAAYTTPSAQLVDDDARFAVVVTNAFGDVTSDAAALTVLNDSPPQATITSPSAGTTFAGGQTIHLDGVGVDDEDGTLPRSAFTWDVVLHHNTHTHPELGPITGTRSLDFTVPRNTENDPDIFFRIHLRVRDSLGVVTEVSRDVVPRTSTVHLRTLPAGRSLVLDGVPVATPLDLTAVAGINRTLTAPPATVSGTAMVLDSWSTGQTAAEIAFGAPARDTTYRAFYRVDGGSVGTGTGLSASYFGAPNFTGPVVSRSDRVPYFMWGRKAPAPGVPKNGFSARWNGSLRAQFSEAYTFSVPVRGDDDVRLTVDGATLIDTFGNGATGTLSGQVTLAAGVAVPIVLAFADGSGNASLALTWSSISTPASAVPGSQLAPQ
ncbi:MAG: PQQ-dependent sugar dehydrogenase [Actinomycetia bacterium]|nr:PQQ-dependent sugar dehydrogenase [Actinomycetes bacterium]